MIAPGFSRLVRFVAEDGVTYYGDAGTSEDCSFSSARVIEGNVFGEYGITNNIKQIQKLLSPLDLNTTHVVRGLGVNYNGVPEQMGFNFPQYPVLFYKPATAIVGPFDDVPIDPAAQDDGLDCEVELVIVIGKESHNVKEEDALLHVFGYTVGNDMTHHGWMRKGNRMGALGKQYDGWCPIGPCIVPTVAVKDPQDLRLWTKINGETVQDGSTAEMIFPVSHLVSFLSQGTTLLPGDIILTGTPLGVRGGWKPPVWLSNGDVMELGIEKIGKIANKIAFQ